MDRRTETALSGAIRGGIAPLVLVLVAAIALVPRDMQAQDRGVRILRVPSRVLGETRVVHVSVPPNYQFSRRRYPVVVVLDGQVRGFFAMAEAATRYDLTGDVREFAMPLQIVVGVEQRDRGIDLSRNDERFLKFLVDELLPLLDREYRTMPYRTLIGHSLGGRFALLALCRAPETFAATIAISPSLPDSLESQVQECVRRHAQSGVPRVRQLVLSAGSLEARASATVSRLAAFVHDSASRGWRVATIDGEGQGHTDTPFTTIPQGLRFVFDGDLWEIDRPAADSLLSRTGAPEEVLTSALARVSARVGVPVTAAPKWMEAVTRVYLSRGVADSAVAAARRMVTAYPEEIVGYALLADAHLARRESAPARRALLDALSMLDKLDWFDETQREQQRAYYRSALDGIRP